jgi:hypothetical protein
MYLCNYTSSKSTREVQDWPSRKKSNLMFSLPNIMIFRVLTRRFCQIYFMPGGRMATEIHKVSCFKMGEKRLPGIRPDSVRADS